MKRKEVKPKSWEMIKEATDIVRNSEDDASAISFLRETLDDDFPDLELGKMDLHEAIEVLGDSKSKSKSGDKGAIEDLTGALNEFMSKVSSNKGKSTKGAKKTRSSKKKRKR